METWGVVLTIIIGIVAAAGGVAAGMYQGRKRGRAELLTEQETAGTSRRKQAEEAHPIRYWLADDGLDYLQKIVFWIPDKLHSIKYYVNNRICSFTCLF